MAKQDDDEGRLYQCLRKYELIVKQFDELIEMMNTRTAQASKRRKLSSTAAVAAVSATQPDSNEALVQTITRFLHELNTNPDSNPNPNPNLPGRSENTHHMDMDDLDKQLKSNSSKNMESCAVQHHCQFTPL